MAGERRLDWLPGCCRSAAVVLAIGACLAATPAAAATSALEVRATVLPFTRWDVLSAPSSLRITRQDVERGFVDVDTPVVLNVSSNRPTGAVLMVAALSDFIERASISGLSAPVVLGAGGGVITLPTRSGGAQGLSVALRFRLFLGRETPVGMHHWPIRFSSEVL